MTRGYLLFAIDSPEVNYNQLAYACALSIKATQPDGYNSVSVVTNNIDYYSDCKDIFDQIIPYTGPTGMDARSRGYDYTPYETTVLLDSDMLFLTPMNHYWEMFANLDLYISTSPQTHRGKLFNYGPYRKIFADSYLPDVYSAWTFFKRSNAAEEFFKLVKQITDTPQEYLDLIALDTDLKNMPTDEAFALALIILGIEMPAYDFPRITHMKSGVQGWTEKVHDWNEKLRFQLDSQGQVKLGVWQQSDLLHYVKKELITDDVIATLESVV